MNPQERLASIAANLSKILGAAVATNESLTEELVRETSALCQTIGQIEAKLRAARDAANGTDGD